MSAAGYIRVNAYTSFARIPLEGVAIVITANDGTGIALRLTNQNGTISPVLIPTPEQAASLDPDTEEIPYTKVNLYARLDGFEQYENKEIQIFPDTVTSLDMELIPLSELPDSWARISIFDTPAQNL